MKYVADLHIHSHYSRATSKNLNFENLYKWAQIKGITVIGTGDLTHPAWLDEMKKKLEPAEDGLFKLKQEFAKPIEDEIPPACRAEVRFLLSGEISSIYKKNDRVRKNHNVVFLPSFEAAEKFQTNLERIGNIRSDGRPILGLDAKDLLEMVLENSPDSHLIPAHIWTPWFSLLGSKSGFDTVEECFEDLTDHIFAVETGLSSDPPMNWRLSMLDKYTLVSNSDAHSPQKLAREANLFDCDLSYTELFNALKTGDRNKFKGTLEFFPEEGKYHFDGHRKCNVNWHPKETLKHNCICSNCGKPVTVGVMHRVNALADREDGYKPENPQSFYSIVPLPEIISEIEQVGVNSKKIQEKYFSLLTEFGSELDILQKIPIEEIKSKAGPMLAEGIKRTRSGEIKLIGGYDGEFGTVKLFNEDERKEFSSQMAFFAADISNKKNLVKEKIDDAVYFPEKKKSVSKAKVKQETKEVTYDKLNQEQKEAIQCTDNHLIISAGPGTGKTRTLIHRIAYLINEKNISPDKILAITFTNKAATEMQSRLAQFPDLQASDKVTVKTFHSLCAYILRNEHSLINLDNNFSIINDTEKKIIFKEKYPELNDSQITEYLDEISDAKNNLYSVEPDNFTSNLLDFDNVYAIYNKTLEVKNLLDYEDLIIKTIQIFQNNLPVLEKYQEQFQWISVDEYQDVNFAQYKLLKLLVGDKTNICAIGDPDQAIYGFRGASNKYFLNFTVDFPESKELKLIRNYRSTSNILDASLQIINKSKKDYETKLLTEIVSRTKLEIQNTATHKAEAEFIVKSIENMIGGTSSFSLSSGRVDEDEEKEYSFSDFAVLYRLKALTPFLQEAIERSGIPYQIIGSSSLYDHPEVAEIIAYLKFVENPDTAIIDKKFLPRLKRISEQLSGLSSQSFTVKDLTVKVNALIEEDMKKDRSEKQNQSVERFLRTAAGYKNNLTHFLETIALSAETDQYDQRADRVTFMSLHASKGLEFPVVFIVGCEDNLIPYKRKNSHFDLNEERRLFYVGMTRAKERLILSHSQKRFLFGETYETSPSPFLKDISDSLKELKKSSSKKKKEKEKDQDQTEINQLNLF